MHASTERRAPHSSRIPLDDVLIRLSHEDFDECFEADGVNLGLGGLSMRAAVLPDVGSRLHCQFESPSDGRRIAADCQVVWAEDNGPHVGEFGLRFTHLSREAEESLRRVVGPVEGGVADGEPAQVRLRLDGVSSPIVADLRGTSPGAMVLEQALPFLRVGTGVEESGSGRRGHLAAVDLRLEGDTPRLVLTVEYEERPAAGDRTVRRDPPPELLESLAGGDAPAVGELGLDTLPDTLPPADGYPDPGPEPELAPSLARGPEPLRPRVEARADAPAPRAPRLPEVIRPGEDAVQRAAEARAAVLSLVEGIGPRLEQLRVLWAAFVARALPALRALHERTMRALRIARERSAPLAERFVLRSLRVAQRFATTLRAKTQGEEPPRRVQKRRTSPPPAARRLEAKDEKGRQPAPAPASPRRTALLAATVVSILAFGAWLMLPSEPDAPAVAAAAPAAAPPPAPAPVVAAAPVAGGPVATAPVAGASGLAPVEPLVPRALPEPTYEAGPMPAPNFPSLRDGARPEAAPGALPASSPYAVDVREAPPSAAPATGAALSFGDANVPGATTFPLRMSQPVTRIHGERTESGFTVTIPDSLSLSRAGPIAARHPFVESAAILNQGTTSILTVRFVDGRRPPFRIEARGTTVDVILGR